MLANLTESGKAEHCWELRTVYTLHVFSFCANRGIELWRYQLSSRYHVTDRAQTNIKLARVE